MSDSVQLKFEVQSSRSLVDVSLELIGEIDSRRERLILDPTHLVATPHPNECERTQSNTCFQNASATCTRPADSHGVIRLSPKYSLY